MKKRVLIEGAFRDVGISDNEFDIEPDWMRDALAILDAVASEWVVFGIGNGWVHSPDPDLASIDVEINLPAVSGNAMRLELAKRLSLQFGRPVSQDLQRSLSQSKRAMITHHSKTVDIRRPK